MLVTDLFFFFPSAVTTTCVDADSSHTLASVSTPKAAQGLVCSENAQENSKTSQQVNHIDLTPVLHQKSS
jgi:hypothetical protein